MVEDGETGILCRSSDEFAYRPSELAFDDARRGRIVRTASVRLKTGALCSEQVLCCVGFPFVRNCRRDTGTVITHSKRTLEPLYPEWSFFAFEC